MRLVFLGPPGSGKGTQAKRLAGDKGLLHLSTGDMLRSAIERGTPTGLLAKGFMEKGELVPDEVVDKLVEERIAEPDTASGYILDGYPRNLSQAHALAKMLAAAGTPLTAVLYLDVDDAVLIQRIASRGEGRADDREEVVRERLNVYREHTAPLVDHYGAQGNLKRIDGTGTIDGVYEAITGALQA